MLLDIKSYSHFDNKWCSNVPAALMVFHITSINSYVCAHWGNIIGTGACEYCFRPQWHICVSYF